MVYSMRIYVDGACRHNGKPWAKGVSACVIKNRNSGYKGWTRLLPLNPRPTNQRTEIDAIILALEQALQRYEELNGYPSLDVLIHSDSRYAVNCMEDWVYKWSSNGWLNTRGEEVVNRDIIQKASGLDDELKELGSVSYVWIPREENGEADGLCNERLDKEEREEREQENNRYTSDDSDDYYY
ncbi:ribonuclease H-like protein [Tothia fuscella]|uniref:ribonuclease H n=1 Tax=Tothia fuscella TaxID=1048955 RepID=A0A9P4P3K0_9PEZI|nr:ribonuclease H-like protein [Tothia fuscella]